MPTQVLPITDLAKAGVIRDTPSVSLPPNVFSDCRNVRFRDGAIRKMEGEGTIQFNIGPSNLMYVAWWPEPSLSPDDGFIVVVGRRAETITTPSGDVTQDFDTIYLFKASNPMDTIREQRIPEPVTNDTLWQHTLFGGGTTLIMNNGVSRPLYVNGPINENLLETTRTFFNLPGWDSYLTDEQVTSFFYDTAFVTDIGTDLGTFVNLADTDNVLAGLLPDGVTTQSDQAILLTVIPGNSNLDPFTVRIDDYNDTAAGVAQTAASVGYNGPATAGQPDMTDTGTTFITFTPPTFNTDGTYLTLGVLPGDSVTIRIQTIPDIQVRAGVIRTYGDLLVAGNLTEFMRSDPDRVVRAMPGVIRTSDVAAPGSVPANWNPFKTGVNTADEFTLSSTGVIQEMTELQGILYVYTNESIHSVQNTGNPTVPFNIRPVARGWGAQTIEAVQEFDGRHVVVGSNDIYIFQGHPGSIQSIADMRVRREFFDTFTTNPLFQRNLFTMLYRRRDEIWISYPTTASIDGQCDRTLIWNYRNNTWTIREQSPFWNGVMSPIQFDSTEPMVDLNEFFPLMTSTKTTAVGIADPDSVYVADVPGKFSDVANAGYESYIERMRLAMTPEFTTENLLSVAMLTEGTGATLEVMAVGTDTPSESANFSNGISGTFNIDTDYKVDLREHGRLLNHRITDNSGQFGWFIAGLQFDIGSGGTR